MRKIVLFAVIILLTACQNKETYLEDFAQFIEEVKANSSEYSVEQWQKAERKFEQLAVTDHKMYRDELTELELEQVGRLKAAFHVVVAKKGLKDFEKDARDAIYQLKGTLKELSDSVE